MSKTLAFSLILAGLLLTRWMIVGLTLVFLLTMLVALIYVSLGLGIWWPTLLSIEDEFWHGILAFATFLGLITWLKGYEWEPLVRDVITALNRRLARIDEAVERIRRQPW